MQNNHTQIIEYLVDNRTETAPASIFSDIIDQLIWVVDFNKVNIGDTLESWLLNADDKFKVEVALGVKEFFPIKEVDDNRVILSKVKQKWPELTKSCDSMLAGMLSHQK